MKKMPMSRVIPILTLFTLSTALTACGSGGGSKSMYASTMAVTENTAAAYDRAYDRAPIPAGANTYSMAELDEEGNMDVWEDAMDAESGLSTSTPMAAQPAASQRKLIRTVHLSVETTQFDQLISNISQAVTDAGGYMENSDISGTSISDSLGRRYAYLTVRVPSEKLDHFVSLVGEQGNITNKSENTQDVTLQYSDIESRKKSLTIEQDRLWELLEKAESVDSIIALEARLSEIRYQLESFESQLRTYDNQVDYSTVSISIDEVRVLTPTTPDTIATRIQKGFSRNLEGVCNGMVNFFVWFLSSLPSLVLLAVVIMAVVFVLRLFNRISAGKNKNSQTSPYTSDTTQNPQTTGGPEGGTSTAPPAKKKPRWFRNK